MKAHPCVARVGRPPTAVSTQHHGHRRHGRSADGACSVQDRLERVAQVSCRHIFKVTSHAYTTFPFLCASFLSFLVGRGPDRQYTGCGECHLGSVSERAKSIATALVFGSEPHQDRNQAGHVGSQLQQHVIPRPAHFTSTCTHSLGGIRKAPLSPT